MEKERAIEFLKIKIREIPHLSSLNWDNMEYPVWRDDIKTVLKEAFGTESNEYNKFYRACKTFKYDPPRNDYKRLLTKLEATINSIITMYELAEAYSEDSTQAKQRNSAASAIELFDALQLHKKVVEASRELFKDGHYRDAIYRAFVEVNNFVKRRAKSQLDGRKLMSTVFSPDNPIIKLNPLETQTDKDEQEGFMYLFMGAMQGIRNPKAHENIIQNNPYIALKLIGFASLLIQTIAFWEAEDT